MAGHSKVLEFIFYRALTETSEYPDIFAAAIIIILALLLAAGAKEFAIVNKVFTGVNIVVILFVIVAGLTQISFSNWSLDADSVYNIALNSTQNAGNNTNLMNCKGTAYEIMKLKTSGPLCGLWTKIKASIVLHSDECISSNLNSKVAPTPWAYCASFG